MIRDAIADGLKDNWPNIKVTDAVENYVGDDTTNSTHNRINIELPFDNDPDIAWRVASIDIKGEQIEATFYGGSSYSQTLYHPKSITDLEELLAAHIAEVEAKTKSL